MKSSWKLIIPHTKFFKKKNCEKLTLAQELSSDIYIKQKPILFWNKQTLICKKMLNLNLNVYCGNKFLEVAVRESMLGKHIGSYVLTKRITGEIHFKNAKLSKKFNKKKRK